MATNLLEKVSRVAAAPQLRAALPALGGLAMLAAAVTWTYLTFFHEARETYGYLVVDSPEIYTRERLVNDRFIEDAWLRRKLRTADRADFTPTGSLARRESNAVRMVWGAEADSEGGETAAPRDIARRDALALFRSELTYRGDIRNLIIENQLDDRHDLRGNSLYRLKFDASVLPGDNTRANALISVTLEEPKREPLGPRDFLFTDFDDEELKRWRRLFSEWIGDIGSNIEQAVVDLKHDFRAHRFPRDYLIDIFLTMQNCNSYDFDYHRTEVEPLMIKIDADFRKLEHRVEILEHFDKQREKLDGCAATKPSPPARTNGSTETAPAATAEVENRQDATTEKATDIVLEVKEANTDSKDSDKRDALKHAIRFRPKEKGVSLNEILNRFAAPKIFQLAFGRGSSSSTKASDNVGKWDFFIPYASLGVVYRYDDKAFQIEAKKTTLKASRIDETKVEASPCNSGYVRVPWHRTDSAAAASQDDQEQSFCLGVFGSADAKDVQLFLDTMDISLRDLAEGFAGDRALREKLQAMIDDRGKDPAPVSIEVESGLFLFIRHLQQSSSVFSYAVTPKQSVQSLVVDDHANRQGSVGANVNGVGGQVDGQSSVGFSGVREQPLVVGYGNVVGGGGAEASSPAQIEFGWFISPPVQGADNTGVRKVHAAAQYALTALVSVPAWWDEIDLKIKRVWLGPDGEEIPARPYASGQPGDSGAPIELPRDLESISSLLLDRGAGPEIEEGKVDPIELTVCRPAAILLPGRRLWRSAVVTLGSQTADEIHVLPNMHGIIAKFDRVDVPSGWTSTFVPDEDPVPYEAPITVWTSEGSRTLRNRARIGMPSIAAAGDGGNDILHPNGTCVFDPREGDQQARAG